MKTRTIPRILECGGKRRLADRLISLNRDYILLALLVGFLTVNNAMWLRTDTYPPTTDEAYYLVNSLDALDTIKRPGPNAIQELYFQNFDVRPTFAFVVFAIPFYLLFGPTADVAILGTNTIFYVVIVFATYGLGKLLFDRRVGLLTAFIVAVNPSVGQTSTRYWPHFSVIAIVALGTYLVLRSDNFESKKHMVAFGVLLGIGLLMRPAWPALFLVGPVLFVAVKALFSDAAVGASANIKGLGPRLLKNLRTRIVFGLLPALLIMICVAGPFYLRYSSELIAHLLHRQEAILAGQKRLMVGRQSFFWYLWNMPDDISLFFFVLFVVGVTLALVKYRGKNGLLLSWFAISYVLASLLPFKSFFFSASIYLTVGILSIFWIFYLKRERIRHGLVGLMVVMGLFTFSVSSWNIGLVPQPVMQAMKIPSNSPQPGEWKLEEIVAFLGQQDSLSSPMKVGIACVVGNRTQAAFIYYTRLQGLEIEYFPNPLAALLDTDYVVGTRGSHAADEECRSWLVSSALENEKSAFYATHVPIRQFSLPDGTEAEVYKRTQPLSAEETVAIAGEVIHLDPNNVSAYLRLGDAYLSREELGQAAIAYARAVEIEPGNASAHARLGRAYKAQGELRQAIAEYEEAVRLSPSNAVFHGALGTLYRQQDRLEEAAVEYERAVELDPTFVGAYWGLGLIYERLGRVEEALEAYEELLRIDPSNEPAQERLEQLSSAAIEEMGHPLWRSVGELIAFLGYSISSRSVGAGEPVQITLWWQAVGKMDRDYTVFVHVAGPDDRLVAQHDRLLRYGNSATSAWEVGETVREWHELELAPNTPPGEYIVKTGIYYWQTGERLPVSDESGQRLADDAILLTSIAVNE